MQRILQTILIAVVTLYSQSAPTAWLAYWLNADAIAEVYCVNPDIPSCHGKCHVARVTSEEKEQGNTTPNLVLEIERPFLYLVGDSRELPSQSPGTSVEQYHIGSMPLLDGFPSDVYHPPLIQA